MTNPRRELPTPGPDTQQSPGLRHKLPLDRLTGTEDRLDRLTTHPAPHGPEIVHPRARLAYHGGDTGRARALK